MFGLPNKRPRKTFLFKEIFWLVSITFDFEHSGLFLYQNNFAPKSNSHRMVIAYLLLFHECLFGTLKFASGMTKQSNLKISEKRVVVPSVGRLKRCVSSQTIFLRSATTFSHYLGLKHCRKPKIENFYEFFHPDGALRSFTT